MRVSDVGRAYARIEERVLAWMKSRPTTYALLRFGRGLAAHQIGRASGAMAFYFFLAAIPTMALAGWAASRLAHGESAELDALLRVLDLAPERVRVLVESQVNRYAVESIAPYAAAGALWFSAGALHTVMKVLEDAVEATPRPWWECRLIALAWAVGLVAGVPVLAALVVLAALPVQLLEGPLGLPAVELVRFVSWAASALVVTAGAAGFYRTAVRRRDAIRRAWPGATVAVLIGGAASYALAHWLPTLSRFTAYYGGLAAVATFLFWLWVCSVALLVGAELNAQLEGLERPTVPPAPPPRTSGSQPAAPP